MSDQKLAETELAKGQKRLRLIADINDAASNEELPKDIRKMLHGVTNLLAEDKEWIRQLISDRTSYLHRLRDSEHRLQQCVKTLQHYANPEMYEHFDDIKDIETDAIHAIDLDQGEYAQTTLKKVGKYNEKI